MRDNYDVVRLKDISLRIFSGITPKSGGDAYTQSEKGVLFIKSGSLSSYGTLSYDKQSRIKDSIHNGLMKSSQLQKNDVLIAIVGATIGKVGLFDLDEEANINQAIAAVRLKDAIIPEFLICYLISPIGQTYLDYLKRPVARANINLQEIGEIEIPLLTVKKQQELVNEYKNMLYVRNEKIKKADNLIAISKKQLFESLGIDLPPFVPTIFSCVKSKELLSTGWYCNSHSFYLDDVFRRIKESSYYAGTLEDYAYINPSINKSSLTDSTPVSFVPMNAVSEKTNSATYELTEYSNVKTGFTPFQKNDLLWAKITPCMQNGKSFFADILPTQYGFASTEFHVIRAKREDIYMPFLWCILSNDSILEAAQGMFSGSAGQQRVSETFLKKLPIALPSIEIQKELADNVMNALKKSKKLRNEAEQDWIAAKAQFEKDLLGE